MPGATIPEIDSQGTYFNNGENTQPYTLNVSTYFPVMINGVMTQQPLPEGLIFWSDAPFVYANIAPEHQASFPDPTDPTNQFQRYSWCSVDGITPNGGLIPMRKDEITPYTGGNITQADIGKRRRKHRNDAGSSTATVFGAYSDPAAQAAATAGGPLSTWEWIGIGALLIALAAWAYIHFIAKKGK